MAETVQPYTVTPVAGEFVAGILHEGAGSTVRLTDAQARYELLLGSIVPDGTPIVVEQPAGPIGALDRMELTRGSKAWDASVGELAAFLLTRILPQVADTLGDVEGRIVGGAAVTDNTLGKLATRIAVLSEQTLAGLQGLAPLSSPAFRDTPTAPTPLPASNSDRIATTAFVRGAVAALADSAPAALDTLAELATALGNDPNFAATIAAALGHRLRVDAPQGLTSLQRDQALANLGVSGFLRSVLDDIDPAAVRASLELGSAALLTASAFAAAVHGHAIADVAGLQGALDAKAPSASPALTGTPTAPTAAAGTSTQQIATTGFVAAALAALVDSSPAALDTLKELATALGNDANFAATMATALGNRLRVDAAQGLTAPQIIQALTNLGVSNFIRTLLDDADASAARATLGVRETIRGNTGSVSVPAGVTRYLSHGAVGGTAPEVWIPAGRKGRLSNLRVITQADPGTGQSWTFTLQKLFADTALTCTIAGAGVNIGVDLTRTADVEANDRLCLKVVSSSGAPATTALAFSFDLQAID